MGVGGYATPLTIGYLGSDVSLRSGFDCRNIIKSLSNMQASTPAGTRTSLRRKGEVVSLLNYAPSHAHVRVCGTQQMRCLLHVPVAPPQRKEKLGPTG
jgi:hypothetical protein